jgi:hypothetical protein
MYQVASTIMRKAFDWKGSRISLLEVEAITQNCDLCPSSQYILGRAIPSCFHFAKMCLCSLRFLTWNLLGRVARCFYELVEGGTFLLMWWMWHWPISFILHFLNQYWIAARSFIYSYNLMCVFCCGCLCLKLNCWLGINPIFSTIGRSLFKRTFRCSG